MRNIGENNKLIVDIWKGYKNVYEMKTFAKFHCKFITNIC